jgi:hypothetical protein
MKKADELYKMIRKGLVEIEEKKLSFLSATNSKKKIVPILVSDDATIIDDQDLAATPPVGTSDYENSQKEQGEHTVSFDQPASHSKSSEDDLSALNDMFQARNMIVSSGRLNGLTAVTVVASSSSTSFLNDEKQSTNSNDEQTEDEVVELLKLRSIFQSMENEPVVTNWNGEFQG